MQLLPTSLTSNKFSRRLWNASCNRFAFSLLTCPNQWLMTRKQSVTLDFTGALVNSCERLGRSACPQGHRFLNKINSDYSCKGAKYRTQWRLCSQICLPNQASPWASHIRGSCRNAEFATQCFCCKRSSALDLSGTLRLVQF